jgi:hypothetical protein
VAQSRAIYKTVYVSMRDQQYETQIMGVLDDYAGCLSTYSSMLFCKGDPSIELFAYHQELHTRKKLNEHEHNLLSLIQKHLVEFVENINEFIMNGLLDEESEKKSFQVR